MATQWLSTSVYRVTNRGTGQTRTITQTGSNATVVESPEKTTTSTRSAVVISVAGEDTVHAPIKTRTSTRNAISIATVTNEDVGVMVSFSVTLTGGLGTVPAGDTPSSPICS